MLAIDLPKLSTIYNNDQDDVNNENKNCSKKKRKARVHVGVSSWMVSMRAQGYHNLEVILPFQYFKIANVISTKRNVFYAYI